MQTGLCDPLIAAGIAVTRWNVSFTVLTVVALVVVGIGLWHAGAYLVGPMLYFELVREGRRGKVIVHRCANALLILAFCCCAYVFAVRSESAEPVTAVRLAQVTRDFFVLIMFGQFAAVFLLTPAYVAGAIADEKNRKHFEFILLSALTNREIIFGKLAARLASLTMILLASLPIFSMLQFLGGIDPRGLLEAYAALAISMVSVGSLSMLASVYSTKPQQAMTYSYLVMVAYCGISTPAVFLASYLGIDNIPLSPGADPITVDDVVCGFVSGNLYLALLLESGRGFSFTDLLASVLLNYALFHALVALVCCGWAVARVRAVAVKQLQSEARPTLHGLMGWRAAIGERPLIWKEFWVYAFDRPSEQQRSLNRISVGVVIALSILPMILIWYFERSGMLVSMYGGNAEALLGDYVRFVAMSLGCATIVTAAVYGANSLARERERQTLESLLTSLVTPEQILFSKWLGSLWKIRWLLAWMLAFELAGLFFGDIAVSAFLFFHAAMAVYLLFAVTLGIWFSVVRPNVDAAMFSTLLTLGALGFGYWIPIALGAAYFDKTPEFDHFQELVVHSIAPHKILHFMGWSDIDSHQIGPRSVRENLHDALKGLFLYAILVPVFWKMTIKRFRTQIGRNAESLTMPPPMQHG